ncbi:non-ribosomal peptide synthetase [Paenibacillus sp. 453mf]|uniref:non-ribosomal peptide synthetase n=1 Tax=Paenibacillus sp. 453mf TaxID=1761874 RepID=UPI0008E33400|nr:non-ribosomal peptide synthetase [Paenibacillus sp. 453mf]SFS57801.1 amino acid adenylation domain-containing protein [Paenibacillus sp. 453mf]
MIIKLSSLNFMPDQERRRLLYDFNDTHANYPSEMTIQTLFERQVLQSGSRIAIKFEDQQLTYDELNSRADELAEVIRSRRITPNQIVGILCPRTMDMVISILAVLKAGAAYMPIDTEYPEDRISYMLKDSGAVLCIAQDISLVPEGLDIPVVNPNDVTILPGYSQPAVQHHTSASSDLAYIIYTSGSTGQPKGVMIEHRNVVRLLFNDRNLFDFSEKDVWTLFHSFCFDFSVWEMYGALLYGGTLVIVPQAVSREPAKFLHLLQEEQVTVLNQTPTAFYQLARIALTVKNSSLKVRTVIFGGEALQPAMLASFNQHFPKTKLINMYGITETTVHVTYKEIGMIEINSRASKIGKPIPTLQIYIVDDKRELVPIGVEGEIYVAGDGVARGYINRPELTEARFVTLPFLPGKRLYRTGDLARWNMDGELEYLGRMDHQVKIRGYRIELGEIESRLLQFDGVQQAVVTVKKDRFNEDKLCAYYVSERSHQAGDLRKHLSLHLPQYMLPAHFFHMQEIPMTTNNKVDVKLLPTPGALSESNKTAELVLPESLMEENMLRIWQELLHHTNMGVESNYFELGGDSIRAIELISMTNKELGTSMEIIDLYKYPTIRSLIRNSKVTNTIDEEKRIIKAKLIEQRKEWMENPLYRSFLPQHVLDLFPMSDIQQGMVFHYIKHQGEGVYHDQFIYRINGLQVTTSKLHEIMSVLASRHSILRTGFNISDFPVPVQYVCEQVNFEVREVRLTSSDVESEITNYLIKDREQPFDIHQAPLWRIVLFTSNEETYIGWIFHHAILDGWSVAVFMSELLNLCGMLKEEEVIA